MTAKDIINRYCYDCLSIKEEMEDAVKEYARQKCEEQRHIVSKQLFNKWDEDICQIARLSPEPEFD